jgi:hypothetical protein
MDKEENYAALRLTLRHLAALPASLPPACLININDTWRRLEAQAGGENPRKRKQQLKAALSSAVCEFCWNARDVRRDVVRCGGKKRGARQQRVAISCGFCGRSYEEEEFKIVTKVNNTICFSLMLQERAESRSCAILEHNVAGPDPHPAPISPFFLNYILHSGISFS